jgi:hypothetical protein
MTSLATIDDFLADAELPKDSMVSAKLGMTAIEPFFPRCSVSDCTDSFGIDQVRAREAIKFFDLNHLFQQKRFNHYRITLDSLCERHLDEVLSTDWKAAFRAEHPDMDFETCGTSVKNRHCPVLVRSGDGAGPKSRDGKRRCCESHAMRANMHMNRGHTLTKTTATGESSSRPSYPVLLPRPHTTSNASTSHTGPLLIPRSNTGSTSTLHSRPPSSKHTIQLGNGFAFIMTCSDRLAADNLQGTKFALTKDENELFTYDTEEPEDMKAGFEHLRKLVEVASALGFPGSSPKDKEVLTDIMSERHIG